MSGLIYTTCGPWICEYPEVEGVPRGTRWTCPTCGTEYKMTGRIREMPWRNWSAPHGHWVLVHPIRWRLHVARTGRAT